MRRLSLIGMGAGDPDHMTVQAVRALNALDVLFVLTKADEQEELLEVRREIVARFRERPQTLRVVEAQDPPRGRGAEAVERWRGERAALLETLLTGALGDDETGGLLVWGDPSLYDGTLAVVEAVRARGGVAFEVDVIPGITSVQALTAAHGIALNRTAGAVEFTTGRRLARDGAPAADDVVVMLDAEQAFGAVDGEAYDIYWGAYLGLPDEILVAGRLAEVGEDIRRVRAEARTRKGWMFDTYLLRRVRP